MKKDLQKSPEPFNRRDFLKGGSLASIMAMIGAVEIRAQEKQGEPPADEAKPPVGPPVSCGVIGCGVQGREILGMLARLPNAPVVGVCDKYAPFLKRGQNAAPKAEPYEDYRKLLDTKSVQAVFVATPTHQHREIVEAALQAGKHVYCEAPLAHTVEDARAIATAAQAAIKQNFQAGLQLRSDPQRHYVLSDFIRTGAAGKFVKARAIWNKKQSWRRASPNAEREKEMNWRLSSKTTTGLVGEIGIHQVDAVSWFLGARPIAVTGFGSIMHWQDGRDVPDTVEAIIEYPAGLMLSYGATLASSFDSDYELLYGVDSSILLRGGKGWLFKEVDSPLLGWEVYAKKEQIYRETGIVLRADATKLQAREDTPDDVVLPTQTPLYFALEAFIANTGIVAAAVEDFVANFGENAEGLKDTIKALEKNKLAAAGYKQGFESTVTVVKANEAIHMKKRILLGDDLFKI